MKKIIIVVLIGMLSYPVFAGSIIEELKNVLRSYNPNTHYGKGSSYSDGEDYDKAIAEFTKAIEENPKDEESYRERGIVYRKKGDYDKALKDCNKAVELNPKDAWAYHAVGRVYEATNEYDKAIIYLDRKSVV
jgi:tetratricopeptide (TPR) repeat protein